MSANLMDLLQGSLSSGMIDQLSQQLGGANKQQTAAAASGIVTTLMGALAKNASSTEGAQALNNALERDHDGSILDDVMGMLSGQAQVNNTSMLNGAGILNHVLGNKQSGAVDMISKLSGLDSNQTGSLMTMLAPVIMGALGKAKRQQGLDVAGIASLLSGTVSAQKQNNPTMNLVTSFLDADGDGSIVDDVANMGMKILGGFFRRKK
ncbi:MAG: DUF937 domain-containing protein [Phaeodactylibacter sp.]|nr:DUF937 domain-containing protein [Phaeodactylibacter sp.]MCB9048167.1 DUF937 domain-containing protein [Lewinellaceae bacterium]